MSAKAFFSTFTLVLLSIAIIAGCSGSTDTFTGRWDMAVHDPAGEFPSWFEITEADDGSVSGQFVGHFGSARPIDMIRIKDNSLYFSLPPQYEGQDVDLEFSGTLADGKITGETNLPNGEKAKFTAVQAPALESAGMPEWGESIDLLAGDGMGNWELKFPGGTNGWDIVDAVLVNTPPSTDIKTKAQFTDFKLHIEFNIPEHSNSGIYLRGRYEVQVEDTYGQEPESHKCGGVYGFIDPSSMAVNPAGEWNVADITFVGRTVTLVLNGQKVIDGIEIPGITGGAINSNEADPGPLMIQGDHGAIQYRNVVVTPAK
jgi:hypothetical protein